MIGAGTYGAPNGVDLSTTDVEAAIEFQPTPVRVLGRRSCDTML